ncbi:hypothetical protein B0H34DRAFT_676075 [Crassisporium funariophilum]|nr:hypothetical protein B0H34DRAFT_676075 [Crassisporium funariophilum]
MCLASSMECCQRRSAIPPYILYPPSGGSCTSIPLCHNVANNSDAWTQILQGGELWKVRFSVETGVGSSFGVRRMMQWVVDLAVVHYRGFATRFPRVFGRAASAIHVELTFDVIDYRTLSISEKGGAAQCAATTMFQASLLILNIYFNSLQFRLDIQTFGKRLHLAMSTVILLLVVHFAIAFSEISAARRAPFKLKLTFVDIGHWVPVELQEGGAAQGAATTTSEHHPQYLLFSTYGSYNQLPVYMARFKSNRRTAVLVERPESQISNVGIDASG